MPGLKLAKQGQRAIAMSHTYYRVLFRVRSFGVIRISDPRSLGSWCIKGTDESVIRVDLSAPLKHHDPSDLGSLIRITPTERTLNSLVASPQSDYMCRWFSMSHNEKINRRLFSFLSQKIVML